MVGGGYIGLEQACIFNNLGAEVHLIVRQVSACTPCFPLATRIYAALQWCLPCHPCSRVALVTCQDKQPAGHVLLSTTQRDKKWHAPCVGLQG